MGSLTIQFYIIIDLVKTIQSLFLYVSPKQGVQNENNKHQMVLAVFIFPVDFFFIQCQIILVSIHFFRGLSSLRVHLVGVFSPPWLQKKKSSMNLLNEKLKLLYEMILGSCPWILVTHALSAFLYHRKLRVDYNYFMQYTFKFLLVLLRYRVCPLGGYVKLLTISKKRDIIKYCCTSTWKK